MGQFFRGFQSSRPLDAGVAPRPNIGTENWNFLKLLKTITVRALWLRLGLLSIRILCFLKSDKNNELQPLRRCENTCGM